MYKVLVSDRQFFSDSYTVGDAVKFYAERADLKTDSADILFYYDVDNSKVKGVITKMLIDKLVRDGVELSELAKDYVDADYSMIYEDEVDTFVKKVCPKDAPVLDSYGRPIYVILKGYIKTDRSEHYICKVLAGLSSYDLSVNADMTVSCNCMLRVAGKLGDLREQSLEEIYG